MKAQCGVCKKEVEYGKPELKDWQMQHLHFSDAEIQLLTCNTCKNLHQMEFLKYIEPTPAASGEKESEG